MKTHTKITGILLSLFLSAMPFTAMNVMAIDDTTPPSSPANLTVALDSSNQIYLSWDAATDDVGVTAYRVLRDNALIHTATTTNYTDVNTVASTSYAYSVSALDAAGNVSVASPQVSITAVTTGDSIVPSTPTNLMATAASSTEVNLNWTASTDNVAVTGYNIYQNGAWVTSTASTTYNMTGLMASTSYEFFVRAYDAHANLSAQSNVVSVVTPATDDDTTVPSTPTNLTATAASSTQINLSWTASTDNVGVMGYNIYRNDALVASTTATSYNNVGLTPSTAYEFFVRAYDGEDNLSAQSNMVTISTPAADSEVDMIAPTAPANLTGTAVSPTQINLSWDASSDNVGVNGYNVYMNRNWVNHATSTSYNITGLTASTSYTFRLRAYDATGNQSTWSNEITVSTLNGTTPPTDAIDRTAPSTPANLTITATSSNSVKLGWNASTDNVAVTGYSIYQNGFWIGMSPTNSFTATGINPEHGYTYFVRAFDEAGNVSGQSNHVHTTSTAPDFDNDVTAPSTPTNLVAKSNDDNKVMLSWTASTDNVEVIGYNIYHDGMWHDSIDHATSYTVTGLTKGTHTFYVRAYDMRGNMSAQSNVVTATITGDTSNWDNGKNVKEHNIYQDKNNGNNGNHFGQLKNKDKGKNRNR